MPTSSCAAYAANVAERDFETLAEEDLFAFVDAYVERSAFSVEQARPLLEKARARGFGVRLHVGQFADVGGAELAAELGAKSVDHVEHVSDRGREALGTGAARLHLESFERERIDEPAHDVGLVLDHEDPLLRCGLVRHR